MEEEGRLEEEEEVEEEVGAPAPLNFLGCCSKNPLYSEQVRLGG